MNTGLSIELKEVFPNIIPVVRPLVVDQEIQDSHWLSGFMSAEGCLYIDLLKNQNRTKTGFTINLRLVICQSFRDEQLIRSLEGYLGCGRHSSPSKQDSVYFF